MSTQKSNAHSVADCTPFTASADCADCKAAEKARFPRKPPSTAPADSGSKIRFSKETPFFKYFAVEVTDMAKTAQEEKKEISESVCICSASSIGFMMTPPPKPTNAPSKVERKMTTE